MNTETTIRPHSQHLNSIKLVSAPSDSNTVHPNHPKIDKLAPKLFSTNAVYRVLHWEYQSVSDGKTASILLSPGLEGQYHDRVGGGMKAIMLAGRFSAISLFRDLSFELFYSGFRIRCCLRSCGLLDGRLGFGILGRLIELRNVQERVLLVS